MQKLSQRIMNLTESQTIAMSRRSRELKEKGVDIINLSLGEPDFNTPDFIKKAGKEAIDNNFSKYPPVPGYNDLKEAIAEKFRLDNCIIYKPSQIVVSTGAKQSLANIILCMVNPGDEVIIPTPYWVSYVEMIKLAGGIPVFVNAGIEQDFKITPPQLEEAISHKTKLILFNSPCNPTGSVFTYEELLGMSEVIERHPEVFVVADEIYEYLVFEGKHYSLASFENIKEQVAVVNGVSKGYAMTGWRIGYMAGPQWLADACTKMQGQFTSGACGIAQQAAKNAILSRDTQLESMINAFRERRDRVIHLLEKMEGVKVNQPKGAFYIFPDVSSFFGKSAEGQIINNANDFSMYLLNYANVSTVTGEAFGNKSCIRISYAAAMEDLEEAMNRISLAISKLN